jgi:putative glycosyltransferase
MELSIVSTLYNSEEYIPILLDNIIKVVDEIGINKNSYEIILVDDGSPDNSLKVALDEVKKHPDVNIKIVELSRNFGHHKAIMAGFSNTSGNYVYLTDADLEVSPDYLKTFYNLIKKENVDVVFGVAKEREGFFIKKYLGGLFWKIFNFFSDTSVPPNITNERIMNRKYIDNLILIKEFNFFIGGIWYWVGFRQIPVTVEKKLTNKTSYSFIKRIKLALEAVTSFSHKPLYYLFILGLATTFFSLGLLIFLVVRKILYPESILIGYTSLMGIILFSTGLIIMSLGLIALYVGKIFKEAKNRPSYIIKNIYS